MFVGPGPNGSGVGTVVGTAVSVGEDGVGAVGEVGAVGAGCNTLGTGN